MAATSAIRCEPSLKVCYERLTAWGKPHEVALVAVMRKLVYPLNTLPREDRFWQSSPPAPQGRCASILTDSLHRATTIAATARFNRAPETLLPGNALDKKHGSSS